ncbi:membrane protein insertase YidC [Actinotalea lenta]|uniref:membrane protein insertase YidC n=1 Tax=Actinotalea lenta TaxID=3064654 RepID=UPI003313098E
MDWFDRILWPIKIVVAWILVGFHAFFDWLGLPPTSGAAWALSIVGLVVVIRTLLIPLFVRQIRASRGLQLISPELQAIQKKYKGKTDPASREAMSRETMELYRKHGTNPFASCLPIIAQSPIFFALFRVLYNLPAIAAGTYAGGSVTSIGPITQDVARQATNATMFGAPISSSFLNPISDAVTATRVVTVVLIVLMSVTTFTTQRQLTQKNMPASALQGPMAQQQKMLLYVLPLIFAVSGVNFPIGVLIYWTTTNLWSMGQQFYVIRRNPTPGSEAERQLKERRARKAAAKGMTIEEADRPQIEERPRGQRQQPKRKDRQKAASRDDEGTSTPKAGGSGSSGASSGSSGASGARAASSPSGGKQGGSARAGAGPRPRGKAASGSGTDSSPGEKQRSSGAKPSAQRGASGSGGADRASGAKKPSRTGGGAKKPPGTGAPTKRASGASSGAKKPTGTGSGDAGSGAGSTPGRPTDSPAKARPARPRQSPDSSGSDK